jgi:small subunit ribosomal protein S2
LADTSSIKQLLEAGAHFGHQASGWHPRMKKYIFTKRNGIHIIDLEQTVKLLEKAQEFVKQIVADGGTVLFVGTKKQAMEAIETESKRCGMYYVNTRWLGGTLTNFATIQSRIDYLVRLEDRKSKGEFLRLPKKEALKLDEEIERLNRQLGGIKEMTRLPDVMFVVDPTKDKNAVLEAKRMDIPVVSICDTNCNPDELDLIIPANDDAIRAVKFISSKIADAVIEGKGIQVVIPKEYEEEVAEAEAAAAAKEAESGVAEEEKPAAPAETDSVSVKVEDNSAESEEDTAEE